MSSGQPGWGASNGSARNERSARKRPVTTIAIVALLPSLSNEAESGFLPCFSYTQRSQPR